MKNPMKQTWVTLAAALVMAAGMNCAGASQQQPTAAPTQSNVSNISVAAVTQDLPQIAVYVTGNVGDDAKKALGTRILASLVNSGRYRGIERSNSFLAEIDKEMAKQRSGAIDDNQISELGRQFGIRFVCIADITKVFSDYQVSARIVNVETAEVVFIGESSGNLTSMAELSQLSDMAVEKMFKNQTVPMHVSPAPTTAAHSSVTPAESMSADGITLADIFFPSKKGMVLTYAAFDAKGNRTGYSRLSVIDVTGSADNGTITYTIQSLDKKMQPFKFNKKIQPGGTMKKPIEYLAHVSGGTVEVPFLQEKLEEVKLTFTELIRERRPSKLEPGYSIPDVKMSAKSGAFVIENSSTDGKCTGIEMITVPAGTFKCYKIEHKSTSTMVAVSTTAFAEAVYKTIWYARGIGEVKVVISDTNGNLISSKELQKLVR